MTDIFPGIHPRFDMSNFGISEQRALRRLSALTHLNRDGVVKLGNDTRYRYALIKPSGQMRGLLHTDREVMVVFSDYPEFQSRTLDAFDRVLSESPDEFRIEKVARILISADPSVSNKIKKLFKSKPDAPVVIPFSFGELSPSTTDALISSRIREFTFSRDLFSMSSPLRSDLYFYGRSNLINEISSKLTSGENFGLFGLRRSGKTSIVSGVARAVESRAGASVTIDCQSPSVHQRRWNELLEYIAKSSRDVLKLNTKVSPSALYNEKDAAATFVSDMQAFRRKAKIESFSILFDEIERISIGTASSDHWNSQRDFLHFWQTIRSGFQNEMSPYSYFIVGTNPSCIEKVKIFESDNPLFGNVEKRFIPMFNTSQVNEMVDELGAIMGVHIDDECKSKLHSDFGGHPFLTRYACSYIAGAADARPVEVDRTVYSYGISKFKAEAHGYVDSVVGLLRDEYPDEYEMLKYLGQGDADSFNSLANSDPNLVEHLTGYGIVAGGQKSHYFRIGVIEQYFIDSERPAHLLSNADRLAELSNRRNDLERRLRRFIGNVIKVQYAPKQREDFILSKLSSSRREVLKAFSFSELISVGESPLYFDEIKSIMLGSWDRFQNAINIEKSELDYHMNVINRVRADAHAKDVNDSQFAKWRVSMLELSSRLEDVE